MRSSRPAPFRGHPAIRAVVLVCTVAAVACSSSSGDGGSTSPALTTTGGSVTFTMDSVVPAGGETHRCQFVTAPSDASFVVSGKHEYTPGSHHMLLFRTDLTAIPDGMDKPADCYESASGGFMSHIRGLVYGAQTPTGEMTYPAGVGLPVTGGEVFLMQTHYLNAGDKDLSSHAEITLGLSDGSDVKTRAGILFYYDLFIHVPGGAKGVRAQTRCLVPKDITLLSAASHYHKRGVDYAAFLDPPSGPLATTPFYTSKSWDEPTAMTSPMNIPAGSRIRYECVYDNPDAKEYFQGQSADADEMCMFIGTYYPQMTLFEDFCASGRDMMGTGTAACGASLSCLRTCPPGSLPGLAKVASGVANVAPCAQKCVVGSCPSASAKLVAVNSCTTKNCATECQTPGSDACTSCVASKCAAQEADCRADVCQ